MAGQGQDPLVDRVDDPLGLGKKASSNSAAGVIQLGARPPRPPGRPGSRRRGWLGCWPWCGGTGPRSLSRTPSTILPVFLIKLDHRTVVERVDEARVDQPRPSRAMLGLESRQRLPTGGKGSAPMVHNGHIAAGAAHGRLALGRLVVAWARRPPPALPVRDRGRWLSKKITGSVPRGPG